MIPENSGHALTRKLIKLNSGQVLIFLQTASTKIIPPVKLDKIDNYTKI